MALKIRLRQMGKTNRLTYRLVVTDGRKKRDGKYIEMVGWYNPHLEGNKDALINEDRISFWVDQGAQLTEKAKALVARKAPAVIKGINERSREKAIKCSAKRRARKKEATK